MKDSFILHTENRKQIEMLTDEQAGILLKGLMAYADEGQENTGDQAVDILLSMLVDRMEREARKYEETKEKRTKAILKRWEKDKEETQEEANEYKDIQSDTNGYKDIQSDTSGYLPVPDPVPVPVSKDKKRGAAKPRRFTPPTVEEVAEYRQKMLAEGKTKYSGFSPGAFVDFYTAKGWMIGKNKMSDWKAAVRNWVSRDDKTARAAPVSRFNNFEQSGTDYDAVADMIMAKEEEQRRLEG